MRTIAMLLAAASLACTPSAAELLAQKQMNEQACSNLREAARLKLERTHDLEQLTEDEKMELAAPGSCRWRPYK